MSDKLVELRKQERSSEVSAMLAACSFVPESRPPTPPRPSKTLARDSRASGSEMGRVDLQGGGQVVPGDPHLRKAVGASHAKLSAITNVLPDVICRTLH